MKSLYIVFFSLILSSSISASWLVGKAHFESQEGDSVSFIKEHLIYKATQDIVSQEFEKLGYDNKLFWSRYDEKISDSKKSLIESLQKRYNVAKNGESKEYQNEVREKSLKKERQVGNLSRVLAKYSLTRFSRSQKNPNLYFIEIKGEVDPEVLSSMYQHMLLTQSERAISKIYLSVELLTNHPLIWSKLGETNKEELKRVLEENWKKAMPSRYQVEIARDDSLNRLHSLFYNSNSLTLEDQDVTRNSVWIKVQTSVKELPLNIASQVKVSLDTSLVGYDLANQEIFLARDFGASEHTYETQAIDSTPSMLANHIYAKPIGLIEKIDQQLAQIEPTKVSKELVVQGFSNISQVFEVKNLLVQIGIGQSLKAELVEIKNSHAKLKVSLDERSMLLGNVLEKLNNKGLTESAFVQYEQENPTILLIKRNTLDEKEKKSI